MRLSSALPGDRQVFVVFAACASSALSCAAIGQVAPPSFQASPEVYKVVAENASFRVIEVQWMPGQRDAVHSHPAAATYFLTDCRLRFFMPDGTTQDSAPMAGRAGVQGPIASHAVQNIGAAPCKLVMFEPR